jgi:thiol-disulfide isomerase/thioredoxin
MSLKWTDVKSQTMSIDEYLTKFIDKKDIQRNYEKYKPKSKHLKHIRNFLSEGARNLRILAIGADWCHDCAEQVPSMVKIVKELNTKTIELKILYGIKVNAFRKEGDILWDKRHSVPEAINPKFNLTAIPTFYIFKENEMIGRIVEGPKWFSSLERDLCNLLRKEF